MQPDDDKTRTYAPLTNGTVVSHYRIIEKIGAGGMGEVYLAEDTELNRKVALKFLPSHLCQDADCRARFKREAQAAAKLSHPNIVTIYEVGEYNGRPFFAMEHLEGQTLRELIRQRDIPLSQAVDIAIQLCEGLQEAHERGIVHRDIKPANIIIDKKERCKVLDFGLAAVKGEGRITRTGSTLGTVHYMSPEQSRGEQVDHRTDLFSLGVVLYEMVAGQVPFRGDSDPAILHAIAYDDPEPLARYRREVSEDLQRVIDKALTKDKSERYQHADEVLADLRRLRKDSAKVSSRRTPLTVTGRARKSFARRLIYGALAVAAIAILSIVFGRKDDPDRVQATHRQITFTGKVRELAVSPDGKSVAYILQESESIEHPNQQLYVQDIAGGRPLPIFTAQDFYFCRWSPDGTELLFYGTTDSLKSATRIIPRLGGPTRDLPVLAFGCWSPDGSRVAGGGFALKGVLLIDRASGQVTKIPLAGTFSWLLDIDWSPTDELLLFLSQQEEQFALWTIGTDGKGQRLVLEDSSEIYCPRWSPKGNAIYYLRDHGQTKDLMKIGVSSSTGAAKTAAIIVQSGLQFGNEFSLSQDGKRLIYAREQISSNLWSATYEGEGDEMRVNTHQLTEGTSMVFSPSVSPNGKQVAFSMGNPVQANIYVMPIEGGQMKQLTFFDGFNDCPVWSPDGKEIAFGSKQDGFPRVWRVNINGETPRPFPSTSISFGPRPNLSWYPCNDIFYLRPGNRNFYMLDPATEEERPLLTDESLGWVFLPLCSPDGRRVAVYRSRFEKNGGSSVCVLSTTDSSQTDLRTQKNLRPIGWLSGGDRVCVCEYVVGTSPYTGFSPVILAIPSGGGETEPYLKLPFDKVYDKISMSPDGKTFAFVIAKSQSDVWLMEHFDPGIEQIESK